MAVKLKVSGAKLIYAYILAFLLTGYKPLGKSLKL